MLRSDYSFRSAQSRNGDEYPLVSDIDYTKMIKNKSINDNRMMRILKFLCLNMKLFIDYINTDQDHKNRNNTWSIISHYFTTNF